MKTILIDDEQHALDSLSKLLSEFVGGVEIVGTAKGVEAGYKLIQQQKPQLVFLDINMKDGTGFDLLNRFKETPFQVIFVTAYDQYAIKAFKYSATDYLMKPIDLQELRIAVEKCKSLLERHLTTSYEFLKSVYKDPLPAKLALPNMEGFQFIEIKHIIRCEGQNNYTTFYMEEGGKIMVSKTLKEYEPILEPHGFLRVYQSHLINTRHIRKYIKGRGGTVIMSDETYVPVSRDKKQLLLKLIK